MKPMYQSLTVECPFCHLRDCTALVQEETDSAVIWCANGHVTVRDNGTSPTEGWEPVYQFEL